MRKSILFALLLPVALLVAQAQKPDSKVSLFDGKTFKGWEGDTKEIWRIEDGCIVGGTLKKTLPVNYFLATEKSYADFVLRVKFKLLGDPKDGFINSGVQIRSQRHPDPKSTEMVGYQADLGDPTWWASLYDESRRNKVLAQSNMEAINKVLKRGEWNEYEIRAEGKRIRTFINGVQGVDYSEPDDAIPQEGKIGLQIHSGGPAEVWFKDITIEALPAAKKGPKFEGASEPRAFKKPSPLSPEEQQATFSLPPGFEIELVACEPDVGKPITVAWDHAGRMWTMTALEYPVDANEDPGRSKALFAQGGRDKVLIFDKPYGPGPHKPRVFADGLAIPLGLLPYKDGAIVQYGSRILFLRDTDGDGKADKREVLLEGFGTEDSHLFPHQFTRGPGGWIYLAQGAFNHSHVRTPSPSPLPQLGERGEGKTVRMDFCKMARFRLSSPPLRPGGLGEQGTGVRGFFARDFELVEAGLNNIWGFVITREGEMFIQEANDLGYPVVPLQIGANYPGIGMEKLKPYAPWQPALGNHFQMGGTGLSGLALAEDRDNWPAPYADVMYLANPITRKIQAIKIHPDGRHHRLEKLPDFILSSDEWFRPVAIHFGPDGCLYIVDWYNKVISHNEMPRNHPDRDKTRGRIWRVRHKDQPRREVPDLTKAKDEELLKHLTSTNTWEGRAAWEEIVDRQAEKLADQLCKIAADQAAPADVRLRALWALEGLERVHFELTSLLTASNRNLRREALRVLGTEWQRDRDRPGVPFFLAGMRELGSVLHLENDPDPQVRAELVRALLSISDPPQNLMLLVRLAKAPLEGPTIKLQQGGVTAKLGAAHDRDFERYLIRAALEKHPAEVAKMLDYHLAEKLPVENRLLAALALEPKASAQWLARLLPEVKRPPNEEELLRLLEFADEADIARLLTPLIKRREVLEAILNVRARLDANKVRPLLSEPAIALWAGDKPSRELAIRLAIGFKLTALEDRLADLLAKKTDAEQQLVALRAMREMGSNRAELFHELATRETVIGVREEAILALASCSHAKAPDLFLHLIPDLSARERKAGVDRLVNTKAGARAVVQALRAKKLAEEFLDGPLVEKLQIVLGNDADLTAVIEANPALFRPVLVLDGRDNSYVDEEITLAGPFTVETWIRPEPGISNADSILGRPGVADFNFHDARFRLWAGPKHGDVVIAKKPVLPEAWTHVALTRDPQGRFAIYLNGELDTDQSKPATDSFAGLRIGHSNPSQGTRAALSEFRVWDHARAADAIRADFDRGYAGEPLPKGLVRHFPGGGPSGKLNGGARVARTTDFPPLLTAAEAKAQAEKFAAFRALAAKAGDAARGLAVFTKNCLTCHQVANQGGHIGPTLNGAGAMSDEALLRNLLTPSAAIEPGYRLFRLETRDGVLKDGFLVKQDAESLILRKQGSEDEKVLQKDVLHAGFTRRSVMPDGQLEALKPEEVSDLFAYLRTLK